MSLVPYQKPRPFDKDVLYEQAASVYCDILDTTNKPPKVPAIVQTLTLEHPEYDAVEVEQWLKDKEFDTYLQSRRKDHLINRTAAKLLAAELGSRIAVDALARLQDKMDADDVSAKDLVAIAKLGMDLNASVDKDLNEVTGDAKVTINLKNLLIGLPPERAAVLMSEYGRTMASPKMKAEIIDASGSTES